MERYKHYSFDLWLTLIKSNPEFKRKRAELFFSQYNPMGLTLPIIIDIINKVDRDANYYCELTGEHIVSKKMIFDILRLLFNEECTLRDLLIIDMNIQELFCKYPPTLYDENTYNVLETLAKDSTLNISSNTGFIHGDTLRDTLKELNLYPLFEFFVFSDEVECSKPSSKFFMYVYHFATECHSNTLTTKNILHIGDNIVADGGCVKYDMPFFQINSNNKKIIDLL